MKYLLLIVITIMFSNPLTELYCNVKQENITKYFDRIVINAKTNKVLNLNGYNNEFIECKLFFNNLAIQSKINRNYFNEFQNVVDKERNEILKIYNLFGNELDVTKPNSLKPGLYFILYKTGHNIYKTKKIKIE